MECTFSVIVAVNYCAKMAELTLAPAALIIFNYLFRKEILQFNIDNLDSIPDTSHDRFSQFSPIASFIILIYTIWMLLGLVNESSRAVFLTFGYRFIKLSTNLQRTMRKNTAQPCKNFPNFYYVFSINRHEYQTLITSIKVCGTGVNQKATAW